MSSFGPQGRNTKSHPQSSMAEQKAKFGPFDGWEARHSSFGHRPLFGYASRDGLRSSFANFRLRCHPLPTHTHSEGTDRTIVFYDRLVERVRIGQVRAVPSLPAWRRIRTLGIGERQNPADMNLPSYHKGWRCGRGWNLCWSLTFHGSAWCTSSIRSTLSCSVLGRHRRPMFGPSPMTGYEIRQSPIT